MTPDIISAAFAARLDAAKSAGDVISVLADLRQLPREHAEAPSLAAVEHRALNFVRAYTDADPAAAASALRDEIVPRCLAHDTSRPDSPWPSYGELLGDWLRELPPDQLQSVRSSVLNAATTAFDHGNIPGGLRVVAQVGFADEDVCRRLEELVATRDDDLGDQAFGVRVSLGTKPEARARLRSVLHNRLSSRSGYRLFDVARRIGDAETCRLILDPWLARLAKGKLGIDAAFAVSALAEASARNPDPTVAVDVWRRVRDIAAGASEEGLYRVLDGGVVSRFLAPEVIPDLLARLPRESRKDRWLTYTRLEECVHPRQVTGWDLAAADVVKVVTEDAVSDMTDRGRFKTIELRQKEDACELLLRTGREDVLPSIARAVEGNASGHVVHEFLELAACLPLVPLPALVPAVLAGNPPNEVWEVDEWLVAQVGSVRVAHAAMSDEAFDALLMYRPAGEGGILISAIDALADLAESGTASGDRTRLRRLLSSLDPATDPTERSAAGAALARLLDRGVLTPDEASALASHAASADVDPYNRRSFMYAFAACPGVPAAAELVALAGSIVAGMREMTEEERTAALPSAALMLYASQLGGDPLSADMAGRLGLSESEGRVRAADPSSVPLATYHLVSRWYVTDPARYGAAVVDLFRTEDQRGIASLAAAIRSVGIANPSDVTEAVLARAHRMDGGREAEPFVLGLLAEVAPSRFVSETWDAVDRWLPQARVALADAAGRVRDGSLRAACWGLIIRLAGDGMFGVRRAAFRAAAELDADAFAALATGWALPDDEAATEIRRRAAEAYTWVRDVGEPLRALEWDQDPSVREAFARSDAERRELQAAEAHLGRVLSATAPGDVVRVWRHGSSLARLGDDRTIASLKVRADAGVPPNVRFWLDRIRKAVQRRWDDAVRKWPEPWFTRQGRYEAVDAVIRWGDGLEMEARVHLWFAATDRPDGFSSWGGWAEVGGTNTAAAWRLAFGGMSESGRDRLAVPGRSVADILVTRQLYGSVSLLVFSGKGPYPKRIEASAGGPLNE